MVVQSNYHDKVWSFIGGYVPKSDEERINTVISFIPEDSNTILDVGCGDGRITNII